MTVHSGFTASHCESAAAANNPGELNGQLSGTTGKSTSSGRERSGLQRSSGTVHESVVSPSSTEKEKRRRIKGEMTPLVEQDDCRGCTFGEESNHEGLKRIGDDGCEGIEKKGLCMGLELTGEICCICSSIPLGVLTVAGAGKLAVVVTVRAAGAPANLLRNRESMMILLGSVKKQEESTTGLTWLARYL
jgi:hypothetical protein